eukprot:107360_1
MKHPTMKHSQSNKYGLQRHIQHQRQPSPKKGLYSRYSNKALPQLPPKGQSQRIIPTQAIFQNNDKGQSQRIISNNDHQYKVNNIIQIKDDNDNEDDALAEEMYIMPFEIAMNQMVQQNRFTPQSSAEDNYQYNVPNIININNNFKKKKKHSRQESNNSINSVFISKELPSTPASPLIDINNNRQKNINPFQMNHVHEEIKFDLEQLRNAENSDMTLDSNAMSHPSRDSKKINVVVVNRSGANSTTSTSLIPHWSSRKGSDTKSNNLSVNDKGPHLVIEDDVNDFGAGKLAQIANGGDDSNAASTDVSPRASMMHNNNNNKFINDEYIINNKHNNNNNKPSKYPSKHIA